MSVFENVDQGPCGWALGSSARGQIVRQHPQSTARTHHIEDRIENLPHLMLATPVVMPGRKYHRLYSPAKSHAQLKVDLVVGSARF